VSGVAEEYLVDTEQVRQDVVRFLSEMRGVGLVEISVIEIPPAQIQMGATEDCAVESGLAELPEAAVVAGTEGPVGREGLAAADAR
jgi:hypothetical protein